MAKKILTILLSFIFLHPDIMLSMKEHILEPKETIHLDRKTQLLCIACIQTETGAQQRIVASLTDDRKNKLSIWDLDTKKGVELDYTYDEKTLICATFSNDGEKIALITHTGQLTIFAFKEKPLIIDTKISCDLPSDIAFSQDGEKLAIAYCTQSPITVFEQDEHIRMTAEITPKYKLPVSCIAWEPTGDHLLMSQPFNKLIGPKTFLYDFEKRITTPASGKALSHADFSPDGKELIGSYENLLYIFDAQKNNLTGKVITPAQEINGVKISADSTIVLAWDENTIFVYEIEALHNITTKQETTNAPAKPKIREPKSFKRPSSVIPKKT